MELLRFATAGSVDDGKSTLIGRFLYDCHSVYEDQLSGAKKISEQKGQEEVDLSLLLDGLKAEREQGITIDVAYRFFSTDKRKFIIADTPGHEQYTRNMFTGASTANLAFILCDARKGLLPQSKRHMFIASLLQIPHILVVINKMDLVNYSQVVFEKIKHDFATFATKMNINDLQFLPVSALKGDMIVQRGDNLSWYQGPTLFSYLENLQVSSDRNLVDFRFPVQYVIRPNQDFRGYAGQIQSGTIKKGEKVLILPAGTEAKIQSIIYDCEEIEVGFAPQSVVITLDRDVDVSRGDVIARADNLPHISSDLDAMICWFDEKNPLVLNKRYLMKIGTKTTPCHVDEIKYKLDVNTLHRDHSEESLRLNEIGRVHVHTTDTVMFDTYSENRTTGCFILIDETTNSTVGACVIVDKGQKAKMAYGKTKFTPKKGCVLWFTGLSGSGKTTIAEKLADYLESRNINHEWIDGDVMRENLSRDLGFTKHDRDTNIDRAGYLAGMLSKHGVFALCTFISPYKKKRNQLKKNIQNFIEIYVNTPLEVCQNRDIKGLYKKALEGEIENFTGVSDPYEAPTKPDIRIDTENCSPDEAVIKILDYLINNGYLNNE